jgi:two-component system cell cycle response regulator CpdR
MTTYRSRALVIDDHIGSRETVCLLLESFGYETDEAADGAEGLTRLAEGTYDLVVTDLVMPGLTGWQVAETVRERAPTLGIVLMTGQLTREAVARARALEFALIGKPFGMAELREVVARVVRHPL